MRNLSMLRTGEHGIVAATDCRDAFGRRLLAMGFTPGTPVQLQRTAPAGDPVVVLLRGYRLILRREEAARISLK